jgi:hypothetical protein
MEVPPCNDDTQGMLARTGEKLTGLRGGEPPSHGRIRLSHALERNHMGS